MRRIGLTAHGVFAHQVIIGCRSVLVAESADTMVCKKHSGKGLFTKLAKMTYGLCQENGVKAINITPNYASYPGFINKLGFSHTDNWRRFRMVVPTLPIAELLSRFSKTEGFWQNYKWPCLTASLLPTNCLTACPEAAQDGYDRDTRFWEYKLQNKRVRVGFSSWHQRRLKMGRTLAIGDIAYKDVPQLQSAMRKIRLLAFLCGINRIEAYVTPNTALHRDLSTFLHSTDALPYGWRAFDGRTDLSAAEYTYVDLDTF